MPKYYNYKVAGYYLYFTSQCIVEAIHVHASDSKLTESGSAKYWVYSDGSTKVMNRGRISAKNERIIREFIKDNYLEMYDMWCKYGGNPEFYNKI